MISVTVDISKVPDFEKLSGTINNKVIEVLHNHVDKVKMRARTNHRFVSRTGNLVSAIKSTKKSDGGGVYIDNGQATYGKYIHSGFRSWAPDPFIYEAEDELDAVLDAAIDNVLQQELS